MKRIVQSAVLLATLLLLTGVASAQWCECYEVTYWSAETGNWQATDPLVLCFEPWNDQGYYNNLCEAEGDMALFWDTRKRALTYDEFGTVASLEFHGGINGVTGILDCGNRYTLRGHITDEDYCEGYWPE